MNSQVLSSCPAPTSAFSFSSNRLWGGQRWGTEGLHPGKPWEVADAEGKTCSVGREGRCGHLCGKDIELQSGLWGRQWSLDSDRAFSSPPVPLPHIKYYFPCLDLQPSEPLSVVRPSMSNDANSNVQVMGKCRGYTRTNFIQEGLHCLSRVLSTYSYQTKTMLHLLSASEHCNENQLVPAVFFAREKLFVGAVTVIPRLFLFQMIKKHIGGLV